MTNQTQLLSCCNLQVFTCRETVQSRGSGFHSFSLVSYNVISRYLDTCLILLYMILSVQNSKVFPGLRHSQQNYWTSTNDQPWARTWGTTIIKVDTAVVFTEIALWWRSLGLQLEGQHLNPGPPLYLLSFILPSGNEGDNPIYFPTYLLHRIRQIRRHAL